MSATTRYSPEEVQNRIQNIEQHLRTQLDESELDYIYVKSRHIAENLGFSSKQVGSVWTQIKERKNGLEAEKWSESSSTTWMVTPTGGDSQ